MTRRRLGLLAAGAVAVLLAVAWVSGQSPGSAGPGPERSGDAVRLGPDPGQPVAGYLAALPDRLPAPGAAPVPALVQLADEVDGAAAAALLTGSPARAVTAVFRVPVPRVQTALRFMPMPPVAGPDPGQPLRRRLELAQLDAARAAETAAGRLSGRAAQVARFEAARFAAGPRCRCVLALLVVGDRAALTDLAGRPGVRAVDAAPADTPDTGVALAPLLPEQRERAAPTPDDGPLPTQ